MNYGKCCFIKQDYINKPLQDILFDSNQILMDTLSYIENKSEYLVNLNYKKVKNVKVKKILKNLYLDCKNDFERQKIFKKFVCLFYSKFICMTNFKASEESFKIFIGDFMGKGE
jgi:hypothetical protein